MREYTVREYEMEDYEMAKESMTNEEAINLLEYINRGWIPDYNFTGKEDDFENYKLHMAMLKAIEALKNR